MDGSADTEGEEEEYEEEMVVLSVEFLDLILVPIGLIIMLGYHLFLLYRYLNHPHTTVMGFENHDRRAWVQALMQDDERKDTGIYLSVISSNISAATCLASVSLTLSSLIGAWISNTSGTFFQTGLIFGDTTSTPTTLSIKYVTLLVCFIVAFTCFIQSTRQFIHATYLITIPSIANQSLSKALESAVVRGSNFWSVGLRSLYFAIALLFWFFGPIPVFVCSIVMATMLYYMDYNSTPLTEHRLKRDEKRVSGSVLRQGIFLS